MGRGRREDEERGKKKTLRLCKTKNKIFYLIHLFLTPTIIGI